MCLWLDKHSTFLHENKKLGLPGRSFALYILESFIFVEKLKTPRQMKLIHFMLIRFQLWTFVLNRRTSLFLWFLKAFKEERAVKCCQNQSRDRGRRSFFLWRWRWCWCSNSKNVKVIVSSSVSVRLFLKFLVLLRSKQLKKITRSRWKVNSSGSRSIDSQSW